MTTREHRCGGALVERDVVLIDNAPGLECGFVVPGLECVRCGERLVARETVRSIQQGAYRWSQTPICVWNGGPPDSTATQVPR